MLRLALCIGLLLAAIESRAEEPKAPPAKTAESLGIVVSPETTIITKPLMADGLPDYEAYLLKKLSEGVTPENNAAVPLLKAVWPGCLHGERCDEKVLQAIGMPMPSGAEQQKTLSEISLHEHLSEWVGVDVTEGWGHHFDSDIPLFDRPWRAEQAPEIAKWIDDRSSAYDLLTEASTRSKFFLPTVGQFNQQREAEVNLFAIQTTRYAKECLQLRSMRAVGEGRFRAAWEDTLARYRLSRCHDSQRSLLNWSVANGTASMALKDVGAVLHHCKPDKNATLVCLRELNQLSPTQLSAATMEGERLFAIGTTIATAINPDEFLVDYYKKDAGIDIKQPVDWGRVLRETHVRHDKAAQILRESDFAEQVQRCEKAESLANSELQRLGAHQDRDTSAEFRTRHLVAYDNNCFWSVVRSSLVGQRHHQAAHQLGRIAAALAAYRADHGTYPERLSQLVPVIVPEMPIDACSDKPFIYQPKPDGGYLLYSVGIDRVDDGGDSLLADIIDGEHVLGPPDYTNLGDDIVIRVPMPAFKKPLPINQPVE